MVPRENKNNAYSMQNFGGQAKCIMGFLKVAHCNFSTLDSTTRESNENGRFSSQLGLAKLSLEVKWKMSVFSERQNYFKEKTTACSHSC